MANLCPWPIHEFDATTGEPLAGGKLYAYEAGTSTPKDTYSDADALVANTNPVILDADGRATVFLGAGSYKLILNDSTDVLVWELDNIRIGGGSGSIATVDVVDNTRSATLDELRGLASGAYDTVIVRGYWTVGDGGGGSFHWDATSTETEDYGIHIVPDDAAGGRWVRDYDGKLNVRYFGAVGDGTTDDATYIGYASAYAAAPEDTVDEAIVIPKGQFHIHSSCIGSTIETIFEPNGLLKWVASINPPIKAIISSDDLTQHFDCAAANYPVLTGIESIRPETFGAVGNGTTDDTAKIDAMIASIPDQAGVRIEFSPSKTYAISGVDGFALSGRSGLVFNGNGAAIKRLSDAGPVIKFRSCSNLVFNKLLIKSETYATFGMEFRMTAGDTGNSSITVNNCYIEKSVIGVGIISDTPATLSGALSNRSEERRVGKEC
jgi:hypothetical protein